MRDPGRASTALLLVVVLLIGSGCLVGPDFEVPKVDVPNKYLESDAAGKSIANLPWWEMFFPLFCDRGRKYRRERVS